jgi:hypothetical protein
MTYQQITWAINDAAMIAAESAFDAFGSDPDAALPTPEMAWDFLNNSVYGDGEIERPAGLPDFLPRQFKHHYRRHLSRILEERSCG